MDPLMSSPIGGPAGLTLEELKAKMSCLQVRHSWVTCFLKLTCQISSKDLWKNYKIKQHQYDSQSQLTQSGHTFGKFGRENIATYFVQRHTCSHTQALLLKFLKNLTKTSTRVIIWCLGKSASRYNPEGAGRDQSDIHCVSPASSLGWTLWTL